VDTAGIRDATDPVERLGVEVSASYVARAAVVLACGDSAQSLDEIGQALAGRTSAPVIAVRTKSDRMSGRHELVPPSMKILGEAYFAVSAETGEGVNELVDAAAALASRDADLSDADAPILTHERHRYAIGRALGEVRAFHSAWSEGAVPAPVAAVHLREAVTTLEDLIGAVDVEDILDEVFSRFCVGK
jgi:tRNA modification GTPase